LCDNRLNDLRRKQDALSADLVQCFDLFHIGVQDMCVHHFCGILAGPAITISYETAVIFRNFTKEIEAAAEAAAAGSVPEPPAILESE
jgi:hypothetical protein